MRRLWAALSALTVLVMALGAGAGAQAGDGGGAGCAGKPALAGDRTDLCNFEHVYNFPFTDADGKHVEGADIELFSSTVPLRDPETREKVLDENGREILVARDFAVVGALLHGAYLFDITDPENVSHVAFIECKQRNNDPNVRRFGDRVVLALAADDQPGSRLCARPLVGPNGLAVGVSFFDVTDPYEPAPMYGFRVSSGAHNFTFHPTKPYGWVSTGDIGSRRNWLPIIDFTDLSNPKLVNEPSSVGGPHDMSFRPDGARGFVAAENNLAIYDTTDPANPALLTVSPTNGTYVHGADLSPDGEVLVVTNESLALGGFFVPGTGVCPGEGYSFYDMTGPEIAPRPAGYFLANVAGPTPDHRACTAHNGDFMGNDLFMSAWYLAGVRAIDFSNPARPVEVGHAIMPGGEAWGTKVKGNYVFVGDFGRGFDVFRFTPVSAL